jgi:protein involved in polysaccharide export with SLBB domain
MALLSLACLTISLLAAQQQAGPALATREQLQADLTRLEQSRDGAREAALVRARLENGDIQSGDRLLLHVEGEPQLSDTFTVGPTRDLQLPQIGVVALGGLLRSELKQRLETTIGRYLRDPVVTVRTLVMVLVEGEVARPGFYALAPEQPVSDAITAAGGLTQRAKATAIRVERDKTTIWSGAQIQQALGHAYSIDRLNLRAADRIVVPGRGDAERTVRILGILISIPVAAFTISRIAH